VSQVWSKAAASAAFPRRLGTAAASLLEAEIVTADGEIRVVNEVRDSELFWALKGGGGGTFGITTRLTLATHPLPANVGPLNVTLRTHSDEAYRKLLARFEFYATSLCNPHWGEQVRVYPDNRRRLFPARLAECVLESELPTAPRSQAPLRSGRFVFRFITASAPKAGATMVLRACHRRS
jgi:hypothetical protein